MMFNGGNGNPARPLWADPSRSVSATVIVSGSRALADAGPTQGHPSKE